MGDPVSKKRYTPQEYFVLEKTAEYKSDFYRGEIFAMAGGTARHSLICVNIIRDAGVRLMDSPCAVYESNLRLKIKLNGLRSYPDVGIYCMGLEYDEEDPTHTTVTNPTVLFEVLSPSTELYDRGFKAENYRSIASLKAYVLVSQDRPHVEIFERAGNAWVLREENGLTASISITSIGIDLPMSGIYARADFTEQDLELTPVK